MMTIEQIEEKYKAFEWRIDDLTNDELFNMWESCGAWLGEDIPQPNWYTTQRLQMIREDVIAEMDRRDL